MGSLLISHKTEPILELNNVSKIFPHFTKEETESERRKAGKGFVWESDGQRQRSCDLRASLRGNRADHSYPVATVALPEQIYFIK